MPNRPLRRLLACVLLLTLGDYLLWNWSLGGNHDVLGLVSGLALPPLLIAVVWLLARGALRVLAAQRPLTRSAASAAIAGRARAGGKPGTRAEPAGGAPAAHGRGVANAGEASPASSSKLAA